MRQLVTFCAALSIAACAVDDQEDGFVPRGGVYEEPKDKKKCPHTQGYWKNHNQYETNRNQFNPWPISEDTTACGNTWLGWLETPPRGDAFIILAHQWIAAQLNIAEGAVAPQAVIDALIDGASYLNQCSIDASDRADALAISEFLDDYNNGLVGAENCEG